MNKIYIMHTIGEMRIQMCKEVEFPTYFYEHSLNSSFINRLDVGRYAYGHRYLNLISEDYIPYTEFA